MRLRYNVFTFFPKSIAEQFRRVANFWFLMMSLIMIVGEYFPELYVSPVNGWSCFGPLCIVISVTMLKVGLEDIARHAADFRVNWGRQVVALTGAVRNAVSFGDDESASTATLELEHDTLRWREVRAGDVLVLRSDSNVPADVVIIATSEDGGFCHIETSNIDGETNLKVRQAVQGVGSALCGGSELDGDGAGLEATLKRIGGMNATVHCEVPNPRIHTFIGSIVANADDDETAVVVGDEKGDVAAKAELQISKLPLSNTNVVLRGSTLRNCSWACGVVVYTGTQTKLMMKTSALCVCVTPHPPPSLPPTLQNLRRGTARRRIASC